jgi:hypothetical protein
MPATFTTALPTHLGGNKLNVTLTLATASTLDDTTRTLTFLMQDLSSSAAPQVLRIDRGNIIDGINEVEGAKMTKNADGSKLTITLDPTFGGKLSTKVALKVLENNLAANGTASEVSLVPAANSIVTLRSVPSAPIISFFKTLAFGMNNAGTGAVVTAGVARIAIALKEGVTSVKVFAKGELANGEQFAQELSSSPYAIAADVKFVDVPLTVVPAVAHEKPVYFFAMSENHEGDSDPSAQLTALPSLRVTPPKISSVRSLENAKITVNGALAALPQGNATIYLSVIAKLKSAHNEENPLEGWANTDVINVPYTSSSPSALFKKEVKKIRGTTALENLQNGRAYVLATICHTATITPSDNHPLDPSSLTNAPASTQSIASNFMTGACCTHPDDTVDLNVDSQTSSSATDVDQHVTFAPSVDGVSTMSGLPVTLKWTLFAGGVAKFQYTDTGDFSAPTGTFFKVKQPVKGAIYRLALEVQQPLSDEAAASIMGEPALPLVVRDNISYAVLKTFEKTVEQTPSADDVPRVLNFQADCSNIAGRRVLHTLHKSPAANAYAAQGLQLIGHEIQVMSGIAGDNSDASFVNKLKLTTTGATTLLVDAVAPFNAPGSSYGDVPEFNQVKIYNAAGAVVDAVPGFYSIRIRSKVKVVKTNIELPGAWQSVNVEVKALQLPSPAVATLAQALDLTSDPSSSRLKVTHVSVAAADMVGFLPPGWAGARAFGYEAKIFDSDGNEVDGASVSKQFTEVELSDATAAGAVTSSHTFSLRTSEGQIYLARVRTQYQRLNPSGEPMPDKTYGSWLGTQTHIIKGKMNISSVLVKTSPISSDPSGRDQSGMDSLTFDIGLNIGKMSPSGASITLFAKGLTPAGAAQSVWNLGTAQWNATKKVYTLTITADQTADYKQPMFVHANHSDFSNGDAKSF